MQELVKHGSNYNESTPKKKKKGKKKTKKGVIPIPPHVSQ